MTALIEMNQVTKTYGEGKMRVVALHETNFRLNAGEFVAISLGLQDLERRPF